MPDMNVTGSNPALGTQTTQPTESSRYSFDGEGRYVVRGGDTLSELAHAWGVKLSDLAAMNNLDMSLYGGGIASGADRARDPDLIRAGQKLVVPPSVAEKFGGVAKAKTGETETVQTGTKDTVEESRNPQAPKATDNQSHTQASQTIGPDATAATNKKSTDEPAADKESLAHKAFGFLKSIFDSPWVAGALALAPAFFPGIGTAVWGVIGILQLGTVVGDMLTKEKNGEPFNFGLLASGLLNAAAGWFGISQLASLGGLSLLMGDLSKSKQQSKQGGAPQQPQAPAQSDSHGSDPVAREGNVPSTPSTPANSKAEEERLAEEQRQRTLAHANGSAT